MLTRRSLVHSNVAPRTSHLGFDLSCAIGAGVKTYWTLTVTAAVPLLPAGSNAVAVIVCEVPDWIEACCFFDLPLEVAVDTLQV